MSEKGISRRTFIGRAVLGGLAAAAAGWTGWRFFRPEKLPPIQGQIRGANSSVGHLLRKAMQATSSDLVEKEVVIIGAGVAGLAAAWKLKRAGIEDFLVIELDEYPGGNAAWGENEVSRYPWGAHYLPVPEKENADLIALCEDLGIVRSYDRSGRPVFREEYLCHDPQERLFIHGQWQEGLVPKLGVDDAERAEMDRFFDEIEAWKLRQGNDGRPVFAIPLEGSSRDPEFLQLDQVSFESWLREQGYRSPALHWYANYSCRDDYGVSYREVSAWAGLHYFAARKPQPANAESSSVLTWPEGNGWLVRNMADLLTKNQLRCHNLVTNLHNEAERVIAEVYDPGVDRSYQVRARHAIYCGPHFTTPYVIPEAPRKIPRGFRYAPWLVANVTLRKRPGGPGRPLSWDNVAFGSNSLGYVVADHQHLQRKPEDRTVITWYQPLDDKPPKEAREAALKMTWEEQRDLVMADLESMHPDIRKDVERIDTWVWGHGMISPWVGFLWGGEREKASQPIGNIHFAHSDLSGISIFEEAFYQGVSVAGRVAAALQEV
jgi:phytoene dehydrogenase-like protein